MTAWIPLRGANYLVLVVLVMMMVMIPFAASDPCDVNKSPCVCSPYEDNKLRIDCSKVTPKLGAVPESIPKQTATLDLSDNLIGADTLDRLCKLEYRHLHTVNLSRNHMTAIQPRTLSRCFIWKSMNFSGNVFERLSRESLVGLENTEKIFGLEARYFTDGALNDLRALKVLEVIILQDQMSPNMFERLEIRNLSMTIRFAMEIPEEVFVPLARNLKAFKIESPSLTHVPNVLFKNLETLARLELVLSQITDISENVFSHSYLQSSLQSIVIRGVNKLPSGLFDNLHALRNLEIHHIAGLPHDLFQGLRNLNTLDLAGTRVGVVPKNAFSFLHNLEELILKDTGLTSLNQDDIVSMAKLKRLDVSHNSIRELDSGLFDTLRVSVEEIDVSFNSLKVIPVGLFSELPMLRKLVLNNNNIYSIDRAAFSKLNNLRELRLQNNKIFSIDSQLFSDLTQVETVDLSSNVFNEIPDGLMKNTHRLVSLNLADNRLTNIDNVFTEDAPYSLREMNVDYNPIWCDCDIWNSKNLVINVSLIGHCRYRQTNEKVTITRFFLMGNDCSSENPDNLYAYSSTARSPSVTITSNETLFTPTDARNTISGVVTRGNAEIGESTPTGQAFRLTESDRDASSSGASIPTDYSPNIFPHDSTVRENALNTIGFEGPRLPTAIPTASIGTHIADIPRYFSTCSESDAVLCSTNTRLSDAPVDSVGIKSRSVENNFISTDFSYSIVSTGGIFVTPSANEEINKSKSGIYLSSTEITHSIGILVSSQQYSTVASENLKRETYTDSLNTILSGDSVDRSKVANVVIDEPLFPVTSSSNGLLPSFEILPTPTLVKILHENDERMTSNGTSGELNASSTTYDGKNVTVLDATYNVGLNPRPALNPDEAAVSPEEATRYYYLAVAFIVTVTVVCVLIIGFVYYRRKRQNAYEISVRTVDGDDLYATLASSRTPLKNVPSIQIESVDDDGNIRVEMYPTTSCQTR
ncbi:hypothetical protein DPMN_118365 [Dreissena polymorpha]|uniref:Uncharacterized protein n=2 Tax=Dreissena polymorpha TaxID=45954 RepID=A0A9D4GMZ2_DREPO|nr:hypothetical protein DPMN_118365 [Dreissena polymorpha]